MLDIIRNLFNPISQPHPNGNGQITILGPTSDVQLAPGPRGGFSWGG